MEKFKIGQEIEIAQDFQIERMISGQVVNVKAGDKAIVTANGAIRYITGKAKGMVQMLPPSETQIKGYDYANISKLIFDRLDIYFKLVESFEGEGIEINRVKKEIEDILMDIF